MSKIELTEGLIRRLNASCRAALQEAAVRCVGAGHREVTVEHLVIAMLEQPGADVRILLQACDADPDRYKIDVEKTLLRLRAGDGSPPRYATLLRELLQDAWMIASVTLNEFEIRSGAIFLALLSDLGRFAHFEYGVALDRLPADHLRVKFHELTKGSVEAPRAAPPNAASGQEHAARSGAGKAGSALQRYCHCFTQAARDGRIDPVFCRDAEIRQIVEILARRRKNNPICVGEAGVGKTAVVEGLALKIAEGDVPESLRGAELYGLDLGALQAGASVKGEFERRLKGVLDEVKGADRQTILFIDEAHTLIGAGGPQGGSDAANLLKPTLARGEIKTIAATTWSEYKKYFEKDPALTRRFQLVQLDEPSIDEARTILLGLTPAYEKAHGVYISEAGVEAAARLSARYISGRQLPDKGIDALDTACARVKASFAGAPAQIEDLRREGAALEREQSALRRDRSAGYETERNQALLDAIAHRLEAIDADRERLEADLGRQKALADRLVALRSAESTPALQADLVALRRQFEQARKRDPMVSLEVGPAEVAAVISDWSGVPAASMTQDEAARLMSLGSEVKATIKGQDHAIDAIEETLQAARLDLRKEGRPMGVFLLVGPSGVGKTETALEIARKLFGSERFMTTINMTEYQERHTVSRLIGSPPGYVGYGEGGVLTEAIRKSPYSVVLLDEVEKADADVLNLFYQAFDKGELADGEGRRIDCKNVVFFLTSNLAADDIAFFATPDQPADSEVSASPPLSAQKILTRITPKLAAHFKPALLARMQALVYLPLDDATMAEILTAKLDETARMLGEKQGVEFRMTQDAVAMMRAQCGQAASGARLIDQMVQRRLLPEISRALLQCALDEARLSRVTVGRGEADDFTFDFEAIAQRPSAAREPRTEIV